MSPMCVHPHVYLHDRHRSEARRVLGDVIRRTRQHRGITQERLGEWAGLHQSVISRLECGRPIGLRLVTLLRLFDALGVVRLDARLAAWHPWSMPPEFEDHDEPSLHSGDVHRARVVTREVGGSAPARPQSPS
ncbi:MAG TPA: helix-turn-helix transcriptional regulator [Candidatus Limnocylindrales bacterium]|nr:helix-turn-helix transcriptional regulator [Candidatus Limnocylindrales bacterium]